MNIPTSPGDALDRLTILSLKAARIADPDRQETARRHHDAMRAAWVAHGLPAPSKVKGYFDLLRVNGALWDVEERLRDHERRSDFGDAFVEAARSVYRLNDERAAVKARVDAALGAEHPEVKSHPLP